MGIRCNIASKVPVQCLAQEAVKTIWSCRLDDVEIHNCREGIFHDGPVVKTLPSNAGGVGSIPGQEAKIPHATWPKNQSM